MIGFFEEIFLGIRALLGYFLIVWSGILGVDLLTPFGLQPPGI